MTSHTETLTTSDDRLACMATGEGRMVLNFYFDSGVFAAELVEGPGLVVGRGDTADVKLTVRTLSRQHARFTRTGDEVWVEDLGSRNGVTMRSQSVQRARLEPGSTVRLGGVTAVAYRLDASKDDAAASEHDRSERASSPPSEQVKGAELPVVKSALMHTLMQTVERVAATDMPVAIFGETGVGKELVALAIHRASPRKRAPFRAVNCGAIPEGLLNSLLFGHEKGSFTGAEQASKGLFEQAHGGTVFLDEIGELSLGTQAALLRVLETKRITRVGSERELQLDTRLIAATHRDLDAMAQAGTFRSDLLFRLNAFVLRVPPLRERSEEIMPLAEHFLRTASKKLGLAYKALDADVVVALKGYGWPGNVRELRNVVEHALVMAEAPTITERNLPDRVRACLRDPKSATMRSPEIACAEPVPPTAEGYRASVRKYEVELIRHTLRLSNGNQTHAAELLKLPLRTLVHKIKVYGIRRGN